MAKRHHTKNRRQFHLLFGTPLLYAPTPNVLDLFWHFRFQGRSLRVQKTPIRRKFKTRVALMGKRPSRGKSFWTGL